MVTLFAYDFKLQPHLLIKIYGSIYFGVAISPKETQFADGALDLFISFYLFIYYNFKVFVMCNLSLGCCLASLHYGGWMIFHLATHS